MQMLGHLRMLGNSSPTVPLLRTRFLGTGGSAVDPAASLAASLWQELRAWGLPHTPAALELGVPGVFS